MASGEERMKVLKMVQEGKITAEDAAELLAALDDSAARRAPFQQAPIPPIPSARSNRWFRVRITDTDSGKVRVNVRMPLSMVSAGIKMGMKFAPEVEGMDIQQLLDIAQSGEMGQIVDVYDENDGEHVEVFIE